MHALDLAKFIQTPDLIVVLVELSVPGVRQIFLDGRPHPANLSQTGWATRLAGGRTTLVVDTIGFNDKGWLDGSRPRTEQLHVIERFRSDLGHMEADSDRSTIPVPTEALEGAATAAVGAWRRDHGICLQREPQD